MPRSSIAAATASTSTAGRARSCLRSCRPSACLPTSRPRATTATSSWSYSDVADAARPRPDVLRGRADQPALALLLEDVGAPARHPRAGEQRREEVGGNLGGGEHPPAPELDVGGEHAIGLARLQLGERGLLERLGDLVALGPDLLGGPAQHAGARVLGAVDAVAEAHEPLAAVERVLDPAIGVAELLDLVEHLEH